MTTRLLLIGVAILAAPIGVAGSGWARDQGVVIVDVGFAPSRVEISVGEAVNWEHRDGSRPHTITSTSGPASFDSNPACTPPGTGLTCMTEGDTYSRTFTEPGTYEYHCKIHAQMTGTISVVDEGTTTTSSSTTSSTTATTLPPTTEPVGVTTTQASDLGAPDLPDPGTTAVDPGVAAGEEAAAEGGDGENGGAVAVIATTLLVAMAVVAGLLWRSRPVDAVIVEGEPRDDRG